ncbi:MAG: hypothetical protein ACSLFJ_01725 [Immundisolibacter sp.]|uniref:hypothetical protein n=1 Tax=Immundisolibacter sp. TaxID=1934948 RepID=UPI003EE26818
MNLSRLVDVEMGFIARDVNFDAAVYQHELEGAFVRRWLVEGQVDAAFSFRSGIAETERHGYGRLPQDLDTDAVNDDLSAWTISRALVQAVIDAVVEAAHWAAEHPDQTAALHAENFDLSEASVWTALGAGVSSRTLARRLDCRLSGNPRPDIPGQSGLDATPSGP